MIHKDGGSLVALIGQLALELCYKACLSRDHLINGNNLSQLGCLEHLCACVTAFYLPWNLGHGTNEAAHCGGIVFVSFFGILPFFANCFI